MVVLHKTDDDATNRGAVVAPGTNRKATTKSIGLLTRGGLVALSLVCWAFVLNVGGSARAPVRHPGAGATVPAPALDASYVRATRRLEQFALNVLVFPLIDDTEPPRWTRHGVDWICDGRGEVAIDGRPLVEGELIPIGQFTIHWALQRCAPFSSDPFGNADLIVEGVVELVVSHDGSSLHGRIAAPSLWIETPTGRRRLSAVNDAGDGVVQALTEIAR